MKNKEIVELLNDIKKQLIIDEKLGKEIAKDFHKTILSYEGTKLLLSYIEQLENNRDKALKKLNKYRNRKDHYGLWCMEYIDNADIIHILKGDSDE